jgi:hypothetical protein
MHYSSWKFMTISFDNVCKLHSSRSWMQVHWKTKLLCNVKVRSKCFKLRLFISIFKSIVVKTTFTDSHNFTWLTSFDEFFNLLQIVLQSLFSLFYSSIRAKLHIRFSRSTWMDAYCWVEMRTLQTHLIADFCIFNVTSGKQKLFYSARVSSLYNLIEIWLVTLLAIILPFKSLIW